MKPLIIILFLLVILAAPIIAYSDGISTNSVGQAKTAETTVSGTNYSMENIKAPEKKEVFFGEWVIKREIASGRVTEYDEQDIKKLLGKKITYLADMASFENDMLKNPYYEVSTISEEDFFADSYVSLEQLGVKAKSIIRVEVYKNQEYEDPPFSTGGIFFVKDRDTLILYDGGIYFELTRTK